jgi:hypothetical protein
MSSRKQGMLVLEGMPLDRHGNLLRRHELWYKAGGKGKRVIFPNYSHSQLYVLQIPDDARGPLTVEADLDFRRYRQECVRSEHRDHQRLDRFHRPGCCAGDLLPRCGGGIRLSGSIWLAAAVVRGHRLGLGQVASVARAEREG